MNIIFADGASLEIANVTGQSTYYQGAQRDSLDIQLAPEVIGFDALAALTTPGNTRKIKLSDPDTGEEHLHEHYCLRTMLALKSVEIVPATPGAPAVTVDRLCVTLAQLTYQEIATQAMEERTAALEAAMLEMMMGGVADV